MSERSHNLSKYCIEFINHYMDVHDPESHFITSVCVVSTSNDQVSSALLSSIASLRSSYLDAGSLPSGDAGHAEIGNLVEMLSLLGFYKDFSSRYFASLDHFYRAYSYSSLLHSSLAAYVRHLQHVLRTVSLASPSHPGILPRRAFPPQSRRPQLLNHLLRSYLQLYVTELLMKLPQLAAEKDWSALAQLYDWFCAIDAVEALRGAVAQYLKEWEHKLAEKTGIPRFIVAIVITGDGRYAEGMDAECVDVFPRGFAVRADDPREFLGLRQSSDRTVRFPRGCENSVSERLVRFIDECVVTRGDDWVMEVMEVVSLMGQKDSFERELRHLYLRHLLQCAIMEGVSGRWRINRGGDAADRRVEEQLPETSSFPASTRWRRMRWLPAIFAISGDSGRKKGE